MQTLLVRAGPQCSAAPRASQVYVSTSGSGFVGLSRPQRPQHGRSLRAAVLVRASSGKRVAAIAFPEKKDSAANLDFLDPSEEEENYFEPLKTEEMGTQVVDIAELKSTSKHRAIVGAWAFLEAAISVKCLSGVHDPACAALVGAACLAAWVFSDLGTGIFHWSVDNYGGKSTPVVGGVIDAFQGHHKWPWTITKRDFCNNIHGICVAVIPCQLLTLAAVSSAPMLAFLGLFAGLVALSQQFHSWSHLRRSQVPPAVAALQDKGLLLSIRAHGAHHRRPFGNNYCIVSGLWNEALDESGVLAVAERFIYARNGIAPRCWPLGVPPEQSPAASRP